MDTYSYDSCKTTGIIEKQAVYGFKAYPNPARETLKIQSPDDIAIDAIILYNSSGNMVKKYANPAGLLDISALANGSYVLEIKTRNHSTFKKIIILH